MAGLAIDLDATLDALGWTEARASVEQGWADSLACQPARPAFLEPEFICEGCRYAGLPDEIVAEALEAARRTAADPSLKALLWHAHRRMNSPGPGIAGWPLPERALGAGAGMFYLLVVLAEWPKARDVHARRGIPRQIVLDTMGDVMLQMKRFRRRHAAWGLESDRAGGWLHHHFRGEIYRLGRLQYMHRPLPKGFRVFRGSDEATAMLFEAGREVRSDGRLNGSGGVAETRGVWTTRYHEDDEAFVGNPVDPATATLRPLPLRLPKSQWRPRLGPGDATLDMHIPCDGPLDFEACGDSMRRAVEFFRRYFADKPFDAVSSISWIFDPRLETFLRPTSNLVRFLREFYLFSTHGDAWSIVRFVWDVDVPYGAPSFDVSSLPADTSLRRGIIEHIRAGGHFCKTGALFLPEDLPRYGEQVYRRAARYWMSAEAATQPLTCTGNTP